MLVFVKDIDERVFRKVYGSDALKWVRGGLERTAQWDQERRVVKIYREVPNG